MAISLGHFFFYYSLELVIVVWMFTFVGEDRLSRVACSPQQDRWCRECLCNKYRQTSRRDGPARFLVPLSRDVSWPPGGHLGSSRIQSISRKVFSWFGESPERWARCDDDDNHCDAEIKGSRVINHPFIALDDNGICISFLCFI